jgi:hypothetical protein
MNKTTIFLLFIFITASLSAQDFGFGFGDEDTVNSGGANKSIAFSIGGEVSASMVGYLDDFSESFDQDRLGDIFSGKLNFSVKTLYADGVINLKLRQTDSPVDHLDEIYLRAYLKNFEITAGLRKLTWGKADSMGPLDVINPLDYSQVFTEMADSTSLMGIKIARPLVHALFRFGDFSKIEGVFVPWFKPHQIPLTGRWAASQMEMLNKTTITMSMPIQLPIPTPTTLEIPVYIHINPPTEESITTLDYAQTGLRFTTTIGSSDIGVQYYYGRLLQPSVKVTTNEKYNYDPLSPFPIPSSVDVNVNTSYVYNPYHQIGFDYAQALFGFNIRAEIAANITEDLKGDDGSIYNPFIAWSFGFDRDLVLGINLNLQVNESIRLMHDKLGSGDMTNIMNGGSYDIEAGSKLTATRLTAAFSKRFLRDQLEVRTALVWGIEDKDFAFFPALIWTKDALRFAFSGGFFAGASEGQLGQYKDNRFLKISLAYMF